MRFHPVARYNPGILMRRSVEMKSSYRASTPTITPQMTKRGLALIFFVMQGQLAGVNAALAGLMSALGPLWAGVAYDAVMPGAPYWMGAIILALACLVLAGVKAPSYSNSSVGAASLAE
jgi:hypothetical protein